MGVAKVLPLAFVMVAGPQILSAVFLATSENWRKNSAAFVAGAALSVTALVTLAYFLGTGADRSGGDHTVDVIVLVLLSAAAVHVFLTRKTSKPPRWMGSLQRATPKKAFRLGFLLLGVFPTDILTAFAVGGTLARDHDPWWHVLPFVLLTLLFLALPSLPLVFMGERAERLLPKVRDWMNDNSWITSEIVLALFIALTAKSLAG
ncbi:GAP family protein [Streptomyces sp. NA13]|uniref:GAP family protein n=1 Tax=Streptomyces sp. NA13 TaxID=2996051 RepID=UPI00226DB641|nr:GAP family protein [Streptomyces sp. NA13]WAC97457.1 GAP family protein [Streptomyces sp. NA13]